MGALAYRFRGSRLGQALHRLRVRLAMRKLRHAETALVAAIHEIDQHAIVSTQAAALYRAFEAWVARKAGRRQ